MAHLAKNGVCISRSVLRTVLFVFGVSLVGYSIRPLWYWRLKEKATTAQGSCPQCPCHCSPNEFFLTHSDCAKDDPELNEEITKDMTTLTLEELELHNAVASETLEHTKALVFYARITSSNYQNEAEKCNAGVATCEEARERAESRLIEERKHSTLWEERARKLGWKDSKRLFS